MQVERRRGRVVWRDVNTMTNAEVVEEFTRLLDILTARALKSEATR